MSAPGVLANDVAGAGESLCIVSPPTSSTAGGTVSLAADGSFTYAPPASYAGPDSFTYGVAGVAGGGSCPAVADDTAAVNLTVTQVNDRPTVDLVGDCDSGVRVDEDSGAFQSDGACVAFDPGPANEDLQGVAEWSITVSGDVLFSSGPTLTPGGGLQFRPGAGDFGTATVTIRARDAGGTANGGQDLSDPVQLTIVVESVPDAPAAAADAFAALKDRTLNIAAPGILANDSDGDGDPLTAVLVSRPIHGLLTLGANGSFSYTPAAGYVGPDAFSYRASDGGLNSPTRIVSLTITAVPLPTPTPLPSMPAVTAEPTALPSVEGTAEPTIDVPASLEPGATPADSVNTSPSLAPGATPEPDPTSVSEGPSLPVLLVAVLFGVLLVFAGAYYVPRWINAQRGLPPDPE